MRVSDLLRYAGTELRQNKGRSLLTATGVTVGVFALTTIVALGRGLETAVTSQLTDDESQTRVVVRPGFGPMPEADAEVVGVEDPEKVDRIRKAMTKRRRGGPGDTRRELLTPDVVRGLAEREHVEDVRPYVVDRFAVRLREHELDGAISYGVQPGDPRWNARVIAGEPFTDARGVWIHEYRLYRWGFRTDAEQAALVGETVTLRRSAEAAGLSRLLERAEAYGLEVPEGIDPEQAESLLESLAERMGLDREGEGLPDRSLELPIRGVVRERVEEDGFEVWEDSFSMQADLFLPQGLAEELFLQVPANTGRGYDAVAVDVDAAAHVPEVEEALRDAGYRTISVGTILERIGQTLAVLTTFVSALTAIALLVAVLGIVNTMVMNVSERTREIGILKALGATDRQVRWLFVVEAGLIGLAGGLGGVLGSVLASFPGDALNRWAIHRTTQYAFDGTVFEFSAWLTGGAVAFAVALSVLAAWLPARRGSRVDPVAALRDE